MDLEDLKVKTSGDMALEGHSVGNQLKPGDMSAMTAVWDYNFVTQELFLSDSWFQMRGLPAKASHSMSEVEWLARIHPDDRQAVCAYIKRQNADELAQISYEHREMHADGHWIWIRSHGQTVFDSSGKILRFIGTNTDITELRATTQKSAHLVESERRWRIAAESAGQGIWDVHHVTGERYYSEDWYRMRGFEPGQLKVCTFDSWLSERVHPDDHANIREQIRLQDEGTSDHIRVEYRERHANGKWIWILGKGRILGRDSRGLPIRTIGTDVDITSIKKSHEHSNMLANAEQRWRIAVESARQGIWEVDNVNAVRYHSPTWFLIRGISPRDLQASSHDSWLARVHPDDKARIAKQIEDEQSGRVDAINLEYRERHADGHYIWILSRGFIVNRDKNKKPLRTIGTDTDITDIKTANEQILALADTERRWRIAVESAGQGLWDINHQTNENYFSDAWRSIRGMETDESEPPSSTDWMETVHPDDRERLAAEFAARKSSTSDVIEHEYRQRRKDGTWAYILSRGKIVERSPEGETIRLIGTDTDITALKQSEEERLKLMQRYALAVSASKMGVWEYDLANYKPVWDKNTCELFGITDPDTQLTSTIWEQSIHPDDRARAVAIADEAVAKLGGYAMDYRIVRPDGSVRHVRCRAKYHSEGGLAPRLVGVTWDVTADYESSEELKRANDLAERRNGELQLASQRMEYNALHDALTGLPNRRHLDNALTALRDAATRKPGGRMAVLHVDLDRFKHINDTLGHAAGDKVLHRVSSILRFGTDALGTVFRAGGDEFVILMDDAPSDERLATMAKSLLKKMREPIQYDGHDCLYGASIGIAVAKSGEIDGRQLLINADIALYRAKNEGRNRFCFFTQEMQTRIIAQKRMADDILRGIGRGEFFPVYQLQFDTRSHDVAGVEALVRWRHPERGILSPDQFLPVAEEINAVARIDDLMLQQALADLDQWRRDKIEIPHVSVNVSSRRLSDERLIERIRKLSIPDGSLSFELLESIYLDDQNETIARNLAEIRKLGIGLEIDDFGTGHASIACILSLRPERFKIDRELIRPIVTSVQQRRLVASIIDIGRSLNIKVIAEGVETLEHARVLHDLDCDTLQGYAFARPMPASEIADFVGNARWRKAA